MINSYSHPINASFLVKETNELHLKVEFNEVLGIMEAKKLDLFLFLADDGLKVVAHELWITAESYSHCSKYDKLDGEHVKIVANFCLSQAVLCFGVLPPMALVLVILVMAFCFHEPSESISIRGSRTLYINDKFIWGCRKKNSNKYCVFPLTKKKRKIRLGIINYGR